MRNQKGFTLLEIIVVLAVLGALAAMLSPVVFRYIDDANRARAAADTRTIAAANPADVQGHGALGFLQHRDRRADV